MESLRSVRCITSVFISFFIKGIAFICYDILINCYDILIKYNELFIRKIRFIVLLSTKVLVKGTVVKDVNILQNLMLQGLKRCIHDK